MGEPRRIQLSRARGWRLADHSTNCKIVDRRSIWGNPWTISQHAGQWVVLLNDHFPVLAAFDTRDAARERAVQWFHRWLTDDEWANQLPGMGRDWIVEHLDQLAGKDLCCWCPLPTDGETDWCHARILINLANHPPLYVEAGGAA